MIRVAVVCGAIQPMLDGVTDYTTHLVEQLRARGVAPAVISSDHGPDVPGVELHRVARRSVFRGVQAVAGAVERLKPDLIHVHSAPSAYGFKPAIGLLPLFLGGSFPLITTLHEYGWWSWRPRMIPEMPLRPLWRLAERLHVWDRESLLLAVHSSAPVVTNRQHSSVISRLRRRPAMLIPVGPNVPPVAVDDAQVRRGLRDRLGAAPEAPVLAFFGFVHPVKGLPYLFEALVRLRSRHPDLHLVVVGGFRSLALTRPDAWRYERELQDLLAALGLKQAVTFTGYLPPAEAPKVLQGADLAVLPFIAGTTTKSSSLVTVLAHGLPTVATRPDVPDPQLVHERTPLFVPPRDSGALEVAIARLLTDRQLGQRLAAAGRRVAEQHDWAAIAAKHTELYEDVLGTGRQYHAWRAGSAGRARK
ncbi:MAG: glycosyltransferase family 4 protein [Nitriliruptorales bacterium]